MKKGLPLFKLSDIEKEINKNAMENNEEKVGKEMEHQKNLKYLEESTSSKWRKNFNADSEGIEAKNAMQSRAFFQGMDLSLKNKNK